jgi:hypothetical protein
MGTAFWIKDGGSQSFDGMKAQANAVAIDGLGGEAIWLPAFRNLWVVKGEWVIWNYGREDHERRGTPGAGGKIRPGCSCRCSPDAGTR